MDGQPGGNVQACRLDYADSSRWYGTFETTVHKLTDLQSRVRLDVNC